MYVILITTYAALYVTGWMLVLKIRKQLLLDVPEHVGSWWSTLNPIRVAIYFVSLPIMAGAFCIAAFFGQAGACMHYLYEGTKHYITNGGWCP